MAVRRRLLAFAGVTYCRVGLPTGRLELALALDARWEETVRDVCDWLCEAAALESRNAKARDGAEKTVQGESPETE